MARTRPSRRELLGSLPALFAVGASAAVAGCSGRDADTDTAVTPAPAADRLRWYPAPGTVLEERRSDAGFGSRADYYPFRTWDLTSLPAEAEAILRSKLPLIWPLADVVGAGLGDVEWSVGTARGLFATKTALAAETVADSLREEASFASLGAVEGYELLGAEDGSYVVAVGGDGLVIEAIRHSADALIDEREAVRRVADAGAGRTERYGEASDAFLELNRLLGPGTLKRGTTYAATQDSPGAATGTRYDLRASGTAARYVRLFESAADADPVAVSGDPVDAWEDVSVTVVDRAVVAEGRMPRDFLDR